MVRLQRAQGTSKAFVDIFPVPKIAERAPTSADTSYPLGQMWVRTDTAQAWTLCQVSSGAATWAIASPGASDVDTINSLSPAAGNIIIDGGTNLTDSNAGSTVTINMDAAITLATSVTSALYTTGAGTDLLITAVAGQDVIMKLSDAAGAQKFSITDSADAEVFAVDSNGGQTYTTITASGLITGNASATINTAGTALTLAADNSGDAVILGGGTVARAITIGQDAAAHTVTIGQAAAGAITVDTAAGISLDAATASNFTVTGAADLSLISTAGSIVINGEQAVADAIQLTSAAGGLDATVALQMNLESSQVAATAIVINASNAAGGIDVDCGSGGFILDATAGAVSLDSALASNFTVTGAADLSLISTLGSVIVNAEEVAVDAIQLQSAAGGLDVNTALEINIDSSEAAVADAVRIVASAADGGMDIDSGTGGMTLDTTGAMSLNGAAASDFTVTGAFDLTLASSAGSVIVNGEEAAADAIQLTSAAGGLAASVALQMNLASSQAAENAILINASNAAGGITLQTGGGDITISNTVKEINAEFLFASGTDLTVTQSPIMQTALSTGTAPTGVDGDVNLMYMQDGCLMEQFIIGTQTIIAPRMSANGLAIELDNTVAEGVEYNFGALNSAKHAYTIGTSLAFFVEATFTVVDLSGCGPLMVGFRKVQANNKVMSAYTDYFAAGINTVTSITNVTLLDDLNSAGQTATDSTTAWTGGDTGTTTIRVLVSAAGVATYTIDGGAPGVTNAMTFDGTDVVMPFIHFLNSADVAGEVALTSFKCGFQA